MSSYILQILDIKWHNLYANLCWCCCNRQARKLAFHFITNFLCVNVISISWRVNRILGFPGGSVVKNLHASRRHRRHEFDPWFRKIPWRRAQQPTVIFLPGKSYGQRRTQSMGLQKGMTWLVWLSTHTGKQGFGFIPDTLLIFVLFPFHEVQRNFI